MCHMAEQEVVSLPSSKVSPLEVWTLEPAKTKELGSKVPQGGHSQWESGAGGDGRR
jgi:hypothetical protein